MPLTLSNPVNTISVEASRTHQAFLTRAGNELATGVKDNLANTIDYVVGCNLSDKALLLRGFKSSSAYVTNMIAQANDSLDSIHKKLMDIKQAIVKCKPAIGNPLLIDRLNYTYRGKVQETIRFIDNTKFDNRSLFDGSLSNFKVQVGKALNHVFEVNIPRLLTSYNQLGINNEAHELQNNLVIIEDSIKRLNQEILALKNRINNKEKLENQRELLIEQKKDLELELDNELNIDDTLDEQLKNLKVSYEQNFNELKITQQEVEKQIQDLSKQKEAIESGLRSAKENYEKSLNCLKLDKEKVIEEFAKNSLLLEEKIEEQVSSKNEIKEAIQRLQIEFEKNKDPIETDLEQQQKSLSEHDSDSSLLHNLREKKDLTEKELKNLQSQIEKGRNNQEKQKELIKIEKDLDKIVKKLSKSRPWSLDAYKNKIYDCKEKIFRTKLSLQENAEYASLTENKIKKTIDELDELKKREADLARDVLMSQRTKELERYESNLQATKDSIKVYEKNLCTYSKDIGAVETNIKNYEKLINKKNKLLLSNSLSHQNIDTKSDIDLSKITQELVILNKTIGGLEQKVYNNKIIREALLSKANELSNLQVKYDSELESLNVDLGRIEETIQHLEDNRPPKLENDERLSGIESSIEILNNKFAAENDVINPELENIELALVDHLDSKNQYKEDVKNLDESFNVECARLELAIKKQDVAKENWFKARDEIDLIENAIDDIERNINLLQINEDDKESLTKLEEEKQGEIENLKQTKEAIATFIENNKEALRNQGGLFIREEFERSNILDIKALESCEEQIDIALKRLSNIKLYTSSIKQFFISEADKINKEIGLLNDLSNKYLATDYLQTSQKFVDSLRSLNAVVSVNIHGDIIAKVVLKLIEGL